jgi:hypothetical protein
VTRDQLEKILKDATGDPDSGPLKEWIPALADALDAELNPKPKAKPNDLAETDPKQ